MKSGTNMWWLVLFFVGWSAAAIIEKNRKMKSRNITASWGFIMVVIGLSVVAIFHPNLPNELVPNLPNLSGFFTTPKQYKTVVIPTPRGEYGVMNVSYLSVEILKTSTGYIKFRLGNSTVIEHNGSYQIYTTSP